MIRNSRWPMAMVSQGSDRGPLWSSCFFFFFHPRCFPFSVVFMVFLFGSTIANDKASETSLSTTPSNLLLFQGGTSTVGPQCHVLLYLAPRL